jgi:hypothetical protein
MEYRALDSPILRVFSVRVSATNTTNIVSSSLWNFSSQNVFVLISIRYISVLNKKVFQYYICYSFCKVKFYNHVTKVYKCTVILSLI